MDEEFLEKAAAIHAGASRREPLPDVLEAEFEKLAPHGRYGWGLVKFRRTILHLLNVADQAQKTWQVLPLLVNAVQARGKYRRQFLGRVRKILGLKS